MPDKCPNCSVPLTWPTGATSAPCPACGTVIGDVAAEREKAALELAKQHSEAEPGLSRVILFSGAPSVEVLPTEPIKLVAINTTTVASGVMPLHFGPIPGSGINFPSVIIEVTPDEYKRIEAQELKLPDGWKTAKDILVKA